MFTSKTLTYLPKPARSTLQLLKEFEQLQSIERDEAQETRFQELLADGPVSQEIRITLGTVNALQQSRYQGYIRKARSWFEEETGVEYESVFDDEITDPRGGDYQEWVSLLSISHAWASVLASFRKYETRPHPLFAETVDSEWIESPLPTEWKTVEEFLGTVPNDLLVAMDAAANDVNPSLWHVPQDETSKKFGAVSGS